MGGAFLLFFIGRASHAAFAALFVWAIATKLTDEIGMASAPMYFWIGVNGSFAVMYAVTPPEKVEKAKAN